MDHPCQLGNLTTQPHLCSLFSRPFNSPATCYRPAILSLRMFELEWGLDALAGTTLAPVSRTLSTSLGWGAFFFKELEFHRPRECSLEKQDEQFLELYVICPQEAASSPEGCPSCMSLFPCRVPPLPAPQKPEAVYVLLPEPTIELPHIP